MQTYPLNASDLGLFISTPRLTAAVLVATMDGLAGLRQGKVQRMTTKNGLPCDSIISFIQDAEKRWWLYTDCGVVELADSELGTHSNVEEGSGRLRKVREAFGKASGRFGKAR